MNFLAVDGGGTKTEFLLVDENMNILDHTVTDATNFNDKKADAAKVLTYGLLSLRHRADHIYAGIAGAGNCRDDILNAFRVGGYNENVTVESDVMNMINGELGDCDGCCIVSGTGSACFAKKGDCIKRIGGWGYLIDTGGSGFDIGRDVLEAILKSIDGRGTVTVMTSIFESKYGKLPDAMLSEIYEKGKTMIASFAPVAFRAADKGDTVANAIIRRNMDVIVGYINAAKLFLGYDGFPVILSGSIFTKEPLPFEYLSALIPSNKNLKLSDYPQVCGGIVGARKNAGFVTDNYQKIKLSEVYHAATGL